MAGGGWEYVESPLLSPSPSRQKRHTCRPERFGKLHNPRVYTLSEQQTIEHICLTPDLEPIWPARLSCPRTDANAPIHRTVYSHGDAEDLDAGEGSTADQPDSGDRCTQAWLEAKRDMKLQMRKMGLEMPSSSDLDAGSTQAWLQSKRDVKLQMRKMGLEVSSFSDDE